MTATEWALLATTLVLFAMVVDLLLKNHDLRRQVIADALRRYRDNA